MTKKEKKSVITKTVYHGGIETEVHSDFKSTLWFAEDFDYAYGFGPNIICAKINIYNPFKVGKTDAYVRFLGIRFTTEFEELADKLEMSPQDLLNIYNGDKTDCKKIFNLVRTKEFRQLLESKGYDGIFTVEESTHNCWGVFHSTQVTVVSVDREDEEEWYAKDSRIINSNLKESLQKAKPYMLRSDGVLIECGDVHPYFIQTDYREDYQSAEKDKSYEKEILDNLSSDWDVYEAAEFLYKNTQFPSVKKDISLFASSLIKHCDKIDSDLLHEYQHTFNISESELSVSDFIQLFLSLDNQLNQEFLRIRTGDLYYGGNNQELYIRVASKGFNWFDIIWDFVFQNKDWITNVTITKDFNVYGNDNAYKVNGVPIDHLPTEEFLTLNGNPIVENLNDKKTEFYKKYIDNMRSKQVVRDIVWHKHPKHSNTYIDNYVKNGCLDYEQDYLFKPTKPMKECYFNRLYPNYVEDRLNYIVENTDIIFNESFKQGNETAKLKNGETFNIWTECDGGYGEQSNWFKIAYTGDNWIGDDDKPIKENLLGLLEFATYGDEIYIQMIQTKSNRKREGIATALIQSLYKDANGKKVHWGFTTEEGTKLRKSLISKGIIKEEYISYKAPQQNSVETKVLITTSPYEVKSKLLSSKKPLRILYDSSKGKKLYMVGDAEDIIHNDMIEAAWQYGYYDFPKWHIDSYVEDGLDNDTIYYILYTPKGEEHNSYGYNLGEDEYDEKYDYDFGTITTRTSDWRKVPLSKVLGNYNEHTQLGWKKDDWGEWVKDIQVVESLKETIAGEEDINIEYIDYFSRGWILPNGKIISTYNGPHYENGHQYEDQGKDIRFNFGYERYIGLPDNIMPTEEQFKTLAQLLDYYFINADGVGVRSTNIEVCYDMDNVGNFKTESISPKDYNSDEVIKHIKRMLSYRRVNESLEETLSETERDKLEKINKLIDDLYALRQESIQKDGEFGTGNLVFKEFRNMGYLDNLKELKRQLEGKDLSLESLSESKEDNEKFRQWLDDDELYNKFMSNKQRLKDLGYAYDIYQLMKLSTPDKVKYMVSELDKMPSNKEKRQKAQKGADLLYDKNGLKVYKILTHEASKKYGRDTTWCIAGDEWEDSQEYFDSFHDSDIYFFMTKNPKVIEQGKVALVVGKKYFWVYDELDYYLPCINNFPVELSNVIGVDASKPYQEDLDNFSKIGIDWNQVDYVEANYSEYFEDQYQEKPIQVHLKNGDVRTIIYWWDSQRVEDVTEEWNNWCKEGNE